MTAKPLWKLIVIGAVLAILLRAWPVLSDSEPYVRVMPSSGVGEINLRLMHQVEVALQHAGIDARRVVLDRGGVTVRFSDADSRDSAMGVLQLDLGSSCTVTAEAAPLVL